MYQNKQKRAKHQAFLHGLLYRHIYIYMYQIKVCFKHLQGALTDFQLIFFGSLLKEVRL